MHRARALVCVLGATLAVPLAGTSGTAHAASSSPCIRTFSGLTAPFGVVRGPAGREWVGDGNVLRWFDRRGRTGSIIIRTTGDADIGWLQRIGSDVWFAERGTGTVGVLHRDLTVTEHRVGPPDATPQGIVQARDGDVYVTEQGRSAVARLDPRTGSVTQIPLPGTDTNPVGLGIDRSGVMWVAEPRLGQLVRLTTAGGTTVINTGAGSAPFRFALGPDRHLWFTDLATSRVARLEDESGRFTAFAVAGGPVGIAVGPSRRLYSATFNSGQLVSLSRTGQELRRWNLPGAVGALQVGAGRHGLVWVTDPFGGKVWSVDVRHCS